MAPDDPRVLFGEACLQETLGAPRIQNYVKVTTLPERPDDSRASSRRRRTAARRDAAAHALARSIRSSPMPACASAASLIAAASDMRRPAAISSRRLPIRAIASLTLLRASVLRATPNCRSIVADDAQRSYERALELFPDAQAAQLGLAVGAAGGRRSRSALAAMLPTLTKAPDSRDGDDPWWDYYDGDAAQRRRLARRAARAVQERRANEVGWPARSRCCAGAVTLAATQPTFSSRVEGVRVDVLVTDSSRRPLRGLTPQDFVIRDNGVPQQVDVVSFGEISLNVGLAFDLSESVAGERLEQLRAASRSLTTQLLPAISRRWSRSIGWCRCAVRCRRIGRASIDALARGDAEQRDGAGRRRVCRHDGRRIRRRPLAADGVQRRPRHRELAHRRSRARHAAAAPTSSSTRSRRRARGRSSSRSSRSSPAAGCTKSIATTISRRPSARSSTSSATATW